MPSLAVATLDDAIAALFAGDVSGLDSIISAAPALLHERVMSASGHYCGYFHGATLLHHVAGNPTIAPLPATTVDLARLLLERGAAVDAVTLQGPSQPDDIGWSTLGLAATSSDARQAGHQLPLLELLVARGADINLRNGGALIGALYYGEQKAAQWLVERGARTDLIAAAGLGRTDLMERHIDASGNLRDNARALVDYGQRPGVARSPNEILSLALVYACRGGHRDAAVWLIDRGANPRDRAPFDHGATPLHWAALDGHQQVVELLLGLGADTSVRDETYQSTPRGWAEHAGHTAIAALLPDP